MNTWDWYRHMLVVVEQESDIIAMYENARVTN